MRSSRRRHHHHHRYRRHQLHVSPHTVEAVVSAVASTGEEAPGTDRPSERFELRATDLGLIVEPRSDMGRQVPALVPWGSVSKLKADGCAVAAAGSAGQLLELGMTGDGWLGETGSMSFVVPAAELGAFFEGVARARRLRSAQLAKATRLLSYPAEFAHQLFGHRAPGRHSLRRDHSRWRLVPLALALVLLVSGTSLPIQTVASNAATRAHGSRLGNRIEAQRPHGAPSLRAATSKPLPAPPTLDSAALQAHEIFGYAPYWTLPQSSGFNVNALSTLAYFSLDANGNGTLNQSGAGWNGYQSQDLVNLVNRAHAAGDRVVLTVSCFNQNTLNQITSDPSAPAQLSAALISAVSAKNLDGVNFDFEGQGSADRAGLTSLITKVSAALHSANPAWQVTMATYASAAGDPNGFYNIKALAPAVDGFFVMAYDMNSRTRPSATAPLVGGSFNDTEALQQFTSVVPASKVILGVPFYGYDWPTTNGTQSAQSTGSESPLSYAVIAAAGHPTYWDPSTQTAWTSYQVGGQWHETYFDNPTSLALKAELANSFHIAGLGIWALGMDGNDPAMLAALLGNAPPTKDLQTGPTTLPSTPPPPSYLTVGTFDKTQVLLSPLTPPTGNGTVQVVGTLTGFVTNNPALSCLQSGAPLDVLTFSSLPGVDVVLALPPTDCAPALLSFTPPAALPPGTATSSPPTTTPPTTSPPTSLPTTSTTTTTTASPSTTTTTQSLAASQTRSLSAGSATAGG
ncbi:MAG: glycosyl hydrolase family 18 protein [Acidimicrobiales bacterium]